MKQKLLKLALAAIVIGFLCQVVNYYDPRTTPVRKEIAALRAEIAEKEKALDKYPERQEEKALQSRYGTISRASKLSVVGGILLLGGFFLWIMIRVPLMVTADNFRETHYAGSSKVEEDLGTRSS